MIFLAPHLNIVKLNAPFAEHWIFSASAGIYAIIGGLIFDMACKSKTAGVTACAILFTAFLYFSILTISRNAEWKDEPALYNNTLKYARFPKVLSNLGVYYEIKGEYDKSVKAYTEALDLAPNVPLYHNNIAIVYEKMNNINMAVKHLKRSLEIDPGQPKIIEFLKDLVSG
ncbi:MAG: tetratricopeptide repeat protein [Candidatus Omnitrophota bacterium]|nr:tetratricopeptide repeat protein [Candidatus Omnitrophota bacterium]